MTQTPTAIMQNLPAPGEWIEITARRPTATAASPLLKPGARLAVKAVTKTKGGIPCVCVMHPKRKGATLRVNTRDFDFRPFNLSELREEKFKGQMKQEATDIVTQFTRAEQVQIAFVPLVWTFLAFRFAEQACKLAASYRIPILTKVTRAVRKLRADFDTVQARDLDQRHRRDLEAQSLQFLEENRRDFTILHFTIQQQLLRLYPSYDYIDMRSVAITAMLLIRLTDTHNAEMDKLMRQRLRHAVTPSLRMPVMEKLHACLDAMAGEIGGFDFGEPALTMAVKVIRNGMARSQFEIV